jgi:hypothetical protein
MASCAEALAFLNITQQQPPPSSTGKDNVTAIIDGKQVQFNFNYLTQISEKQPDKIEDQSEFEDHTLTVLIGPSKRLQALMAPIKYPGLSRASKRVLWFNQPLAANLGTTYEVIAPEPVLSGDPIKDGLNII